MFCLLFNIFSMFPRVGVWKTIFLLFYLKLCRARKKSAGMLLLIHLSLECRARILKLKNAAVCLVFENIRNMYFHIKAISWLPLARVHFSLASLYREWEDFSFFFKKRFIKVKSNKSILGALKFPNRKQNRLYIALEIDTIVLFIYSYYSQDAGNHVKFMN